MIAEDRAPMIKQPEVGATYDAFLNKPEVINPHHHHHQLSILVTICNHHHQHLDQSLSQQVCSVYMSQYVQHTINNHPLHPPKLVTGMMTSNNQVCRVDMSQSAKKIHNFIRGLDSSPGAFKEHQLQPQNCFGKTSSP